MASESDLNKGPVGRALIRVSAPMTLGILGVLSVGLADAFFLARDSEGALAAIGFIYPVIATLTSLSIGLSAGTSAVMSQAIGKGVKPVRRQRLALHAMALAAVLSTIVSVLFYFGAPFLFGLMGAKGQVLDAVMAYVPWWCLSFPPMVTGMALNAAFRAAGRSSVAATTMLVQSALNIALDPLLIFGWGPVPGLGIEGAGLATFIARLAGFLGLMAFAFYTAAVRLNCRPRRNLRRSVRRITKVGVPAAVSNAINPAGMAAVTAAVAVVGDAAVAGFGAAGRVQALILVPMLALSSGIGPVVGQAWGADKEDRAQAAVRLTFLLCLGYGLGLAVLLMLFAEPIARLMTAGDGATEYAAIYLRISGWAFFAYGVLITANAAMNARDKAMWSMVISAARIGLIFVPLAWAGVMTAGYAGVVIAGVLANLIGAWAAMVGCRAVGLLKLDWAIIRGPAMHLNNALPARD